MQEMRFKMAAYDLSINGKTVRVEAEADMPVLWAVRDLVGLTGTKYSCGMALCGACTILVDGEPLRSCVTTVSAVAGRKITTIEGLEGKIGSAVQTAWQDLSVPQCGYCQSGQILAATALLTQKPKPTDQDIDTAMAGNICRCGTYADIRRAIHKAADLVERS
jgi:isoquinoline 1-oxidoreductase alpha subunit